MFVQTDLNFAPDVVRSVSVKNFKKNADVLGDSGDVLRRPNIFLYQFLWKMKLLLYFHVAEKKKVKRRGF